MLVEGMALGAYAMGASEGVVYVRAEYPLAIDRLDKAIAEARVAGLLGKSILDTGFSFDIEVVTGAGAFVCGEETALIASAEGKAGRPMPRPPFPAQRGYMGKPTNINNVETWCNVPLIVARGGEWFAGFGTARSAGTKVFSLVGKVRKRASSSCPWAPPRRDGLRHGRGGRPAQADQGRPIGRPLGRLRAREPLQDQDRLRGAREARRHHGLGRHGRHGPGQLHGRRGPILRRLHGRRVLRQVHALPRGH